MRVRSLLILGTMVLGVMLLGGVALAVTKTCTTMPWALILCKTSFSSRKMMASLSAPSSIFQSAGSAAAWLLRGRKTSYAARASASPTLTM